MYGYHIPEQSKRPHKYETLDIDSEDEKWLRNPRQFKAKLKQKPKKHDDDWISFFRYQVGGLKSPGSFFRYEVVSTAPADHWYSQQQSLDDLVVQSC